MKKHLFFLFAALALLTAPVAMRAQTTVTIGEEGNISSAGPFASFWNYSFSEMVYTAAEIGMPSGGTITKIRYHLESSSPTQTNNITLYMKNVSRSTFSNSSDYESLTVSDIVYNGNVTFSPGWCTITLTTPFVYDGTSNLMIACDENTIEDQELQFYSTDKASSCLYYYSDSSNPDPYNLAIYAGNKGVYPNRADIQFEFANTVTIAGETGSSAESPYASAWSYSVTEQIYTAEEIGVSEGGIITSIQFRQESVASETNHITVFMKNVSRSSFASTSDYEALSADDIVYEGDFTFSLGWCSIPLDVPFNYDGTSNLMIAIHENTPGHMQQTFYYKNVGNSVYRLLSDSEDPDPYDIGSSTASKYISDRRAIVKIAITPLPTSSPTVNDGTATNGYVPVYGFYADAYLKAEFVMPSSSLTSIGTGNEITDMTFYAASGYENVSWPGSNFLVFLKEVGSTTLSTYTGYGDATVVYEGDLSIVDGQMKVTFTTPYTYHGGNLLIGVYNTEEGEYNSSHWLGVSAPGASIQGYDYDDIDEAPADQRDFLPKTTFGVNSIIDFEPGDFSQFTFANHAPYPWTVEAAPTDCENCGSYCMRSGNAGVHSSSSTIEAVYDFASVGTISFDAKCMGEGTSTLWDHCDFLIDGVQQFTHGADLSGWNHYEYTVTAGTHTFTWMYTKDSSVNPTGDGFFVDNIKFGSGYPCDAPENLAVTQIDNSHFTVTWDPVSGATGYDLVIAGVTLPTIPAPTTELSFNTELSETTKTAKVRAHCASGELSDWTQITFMPYHIYTTANWYGYAAYSVDGEDWEEKFISFNMQDLATVTPATSTTVPQMYAATYANGYVWSITTGGDLLRATLDNSSRTISDFETLAIDYETEGVVRSMAHNPADGRIYYIYSSNGTTTTTIKSFDPTSPSLPELHAICDRTIMTLAINGDGDAVGVELSTGDLYELTLATGSCQLVGNTGQGCNYVQSMAYDLTQFELFWAQIDNIGNGLYKVNPSTTETAYIGKIGGGEGVELVGMFKGDDYEITCQPPTNLTISNVGPYSADVSWTGPSDGNEWTVQYSTSPDFSTNVTDFVTTTTAQLTGLTPETTYYVHVNNFCGTMGASVWTYAVSFTTEVACPAPTDLAADNITGSSAEVSWTGTGDSYTVRYRPSSILFSDDFENGLGQWTLLDNDGDGHNWFDVASAGSLYSYYDGSNLDDWVYNGSNAAVSGSYINYVGALTPDNWLITPQVQLDGQVSFMAKSAEASYPEHFAVYVSTTGTNPADFTMVSAEFESSSDWESYDIDLSSFSGQQGYVAIRNFDVYDQYLLVVDDFVISIPGESWQTVVTTSSDATITGLNSETDYEFQVQSDCGSDGTSGWSEMGYFTTSASNILSTGNWYAYANTSDYTTSDYLKKFVSFSMGNPSNVDEASATIGGQVTAAAFANGYVWYNNYSNGKALYRAPLDNVSKTIGAGDVFDPNFIPGDYAVAMSYNPLDGQIYFVAYDYDGTNEFYSLYKFDPEASVPASIPVGLLSIEPSAMAINSSGVAYCIDYLDRFHLLDLGDASTTLIGNMGEFQVGYWQSMAFDLSTDELFWAQYNNDGANLYLVNPATAGVTPVGSIGDGYTQFLGLFKGGDGPACLAPANLSVYNIGQYGADLNWNGSAGSWVVEWSASPDYSSPSSLTLTATNLHLADLMSGTRYYVRVKADCGTDGESLWSYSSFMTAFCGAGDQCLISYELSDSYGDGWNGCAIDVLDLASGAVIATLTIPDGDSSTGTLAVCDGQEIAFQWVDGLWSDEVLYTFYDASGTVILDGVGAFSTSVTYTVSCPAVACPAPTNLTVSNIGSVGAGVSWEQPGSADQWIVQCSTNSDFSTASEVPVGSTSWYIYSLTPNTTYYVRVANDCGSDGISAWSNTETFTTTESPCIAPTDLTVSNISHNGAELSWNQPDGGFDWLIEYSTNSDFSSSTFENSFETHWSLTGLSLNTTYYVRVANDCGTMGASEWLTTSFTTNASACPKPTGLHVENLSSDNAVLYWTENGSATSWSVGIATTLEGLSSADYHNATTQSYDFSHTLVPGTTYYAAVQSNCGGGLHSILSMVTFTTPSASESDIIDFEPGDFSQYPFDNSSSYPWIIADASNGCDNGTTYCMRSGNAGVHGSTSTIEATYDYPAAGYIVFDAKCMGEGSHYDVCEFSIDGVQQFSYGNNMLGWNSYWYLVPSGSHTFTWSYTKDSSVNPTGDGFFVDNIKFDVGEPCLTPTNLAATATVDGTATVSWLGYSTSFSLRYRTVGSSVWTTLTGISDNSYTITGLNPGDYEVEVSASCDPTNWIPATFTVVEVLSTANWYGYSVYSIDGEAWDNKFISFSMQNPATVSAATSSTVTNNYAAAYANGYVWCITTGGDLLRATLDNTAKTISDFETVVSGFESNTVASMSYNPADGRIYYIVPDDSRLMSFSPSDINDVEEEGVLSIYVITMAINNAGIAYCIENGSGDLYQMNLNGASTTLVGSTGQDCNYVQSMAFDLTTGELFWAQVYTVDDISLYKVNPATAEVFFLGQIGGGSGVELTGLFMGDDYEITCPAPSNLSVSNVGPSSATLDWTENGTATEWQICVNGDESNLITVTDNPYTLTGLTPETSYTVKVRANCGGSDGVSVWSAAENFTTTEPCPAPYNLASSDPTANSVDVTWTGFGEQYTVRYRPSSILFSDDFESGLGQWTQIDADGDGYGWLLGSDLMGGSYSAHSGTDIAVSQSYDNNIGALTPDNYLVTPQITLGGTVEFWAKAQDPSYPSEHFSIAVSTAGNTNPDDFQTLYEWTMTPGGWYQYTIDLSAYAGQQGYVALRHHDCTDMYYLDIDDFIIYEPTVPWTTVTSNSSSFTLNGLDSETSYEFQVQSDCGVDGTSGWSEMAYFTTGNNVCPAPTELAVYPNNTNAFGLSWTESGTASAWNVQIDTDPAFPNGASSDTIVTDMSIGFDDLDLETTYYVRVRSLCGGDEFSSWVTTSYTTPACPAPTGLTVSNITSTSADLDWSHSGYEWVIEYSTSSDFSSSNAEWILSNSWTLTDLAPGTTYYVRVQAICPLSVPGGVSDVVSFTTETACPSPTDLEVNYITKYSAELSWTEYGPAGDWFVQIDTDPEFPNGPTSEFAVSTLLAPITDLTPGTTYYVRVRALCTGGEFSTWATTSFTTLPCVAPSDLNISQITAHSARVAWMENTDALTWYIILNNDEEHLIEVTGNNYYTLTGLAPETEYTVAVRSECGPAVSDWSPTVSFTTEAVSCPAPTSLAVSNVTNHTADLSWTENGSAVIWYVMLNGDEAHAIEVTDNPATIYGLTPETTYTVSVRSDCGDDVYSAWSSAVTFTTDVPCAAPADLAVSNVGGSNATLEWTSGGSYLLRYRVSGGTWVSAVTEGVTSPYTLGGLQTSTTYEVQAMADCGSDGLSEWGNTVSFTTESCAVPTDLVVAAVTANSITLDWASGDVYNMRYNWTGSGTGWHSLSGLTPPYTLTNLLPNTQYRFQVKNPCVNTWSELVYATTLACVTPDDLSVTDITTDGATVTWTSGGTYNLRYREAGGEWTSVTGVTSPYAITGLHANGSYEVSAQNDCGSDGLSGWSDATSFTSAPCAPQAVPYSYGFETEDPFYCWRPLAGSVTRSHVTAPSYNHTAGGEYALAFFESASDLVALPQFAQETSGLQVMLWLRPQNNVFSGNGTFEVGYLTDPSDASTFTAVGTYSYDDWASNTYVRKIVAFPGAPAGSAIAFRHNSPTANGIWYVDDILVSAVCPMPENITVTNVTNSSATVTWTDNGAASWDVSLVDMDDYANNTATNSYTLTGLNGGATYNVKVRSNCGDGVVSDWSEKVYFTTSTSVVPAYATITGEGAVCHLQTTALTAHTDVPATYLWNTGATTQSINAGPGTYTVTVTSSTGDQLASDPFVVAEKPSFAVTENRSVCPDQLPYTWNGFTFTLPGTQAVTLTASNGCDSVVTMNLSLNPTYTVPVAETICQGESYTFGGQALTAGGEYRDTLQTASGCDSIIVLTLTVNPSYSVDAERTVCQSELPYTWNGVTFSEAGTQSATLQTVNGCDSVVAMTLHVNPVYTTPVTAAICQGGSYTFGGQALTAGGEYRDTLQTANGCDSIIVLTLTVNPTYAVDDEQTVCPSLLPYTWNGVTFNEAGTQSATLQTVDGCDSVVTMTLHVSPSYNVPVAASVCNGEAYNFFGQLLTASGEYTHQLQTVDGCDSIITLTLTVNETYLVTENRTVCPAAMPYVWNGVTFNAPGTKYVTLQTVNGCDSVVTMVLSVNDGFEITETREICNSELPYVWNGKTFTGPGTKYAELTASNGCDSVVTMVLVVNTPVHQAFTVEACGSYTWTDGVTYTASGDHTYSHADAHGCTQVDTLHLTIYNPVHQSYTAEACGSYTWADGDGQTYTTSGDRTYSHLDAHGCTQVDTLHLTIYNPVHQSYTEEACGSFTWTDGDGQTYTASGVHTYSHEDAHGCTQVDTLHLTVYNPVHQSYTAEACGSYTWVDGVTYTASGDHTYSHLDAHGCTQVDTLHLTIHNPVHQAYTEEACGSYTWTDGDGQTYTASGDHTYSHADAHGCTQVDTLHLTVYNPVHQAYTEEACGSYTWIDGETYTASGVHTYSHEDAHGCTQVDTLHLTIYNPVHTAVMETACGSYTWNGVTYTTSGDYTYSHLDANGCTQVDTLHLTVNVPANQAYTVAECGSYTWTEGDGQTYTTSGVRTYTHPDANGCTQVDTLYLTILQGSSAVVANTVCAEDMPYEWNGVTFTQAGMQTATIEAANGCDSVVTMVLMVNTPVHTAVTVTECGSYTWNGTTYTATGNYTYSHADVNGCTQVDTLHLTILTPANTAVTVSECGSYTWTANGQTYTASGDYTYSHVDANGCMQVDTLHLTIYNPVHTAVTVAECGSYVWHGTTYTESGNYTYAHADAHGCTQVDTLHLTIHNPVHQAYNVEACGSYTWTDGDGQTYYTSGDHTYSHADANGCTQVDTLHLTILQGSSAVVANTICAEELPYEWNGVTFTAAGIQTATIVAANGCDSVVTMVLTVNTPVHGSLTVEECGSYTWTANGQTYTASGDYTYSHQDVNGCTQVDTLHLTILTPAHTAVTVEECGDYTWNGQTYTASGDYTYSHTDANGCTQVDTLHLTIHNPVHTAVTATACGSYTWNGQTYTASGDYTYSHLDANGCTQVDTLHLTIGAAVSIDLYETSCGSYYWNNANYTETGNYTVTYTSAGGCDSVVTLHLTINQAVQTELYETACDSYTWDDGNTYTQSDDYSMTLTAANGCDSVVVLHLTVNNSTSSEFSIETSDSCYTWNGQTYCASGDYVQTLTAANGCDSVVTLHLTTSVGVDDHEVSLVYLAPNPATTVCRIVGLETAPVSVELYDMRGKLLLRGDKAEFDVRTLPTGMYTVRVNTGSRVVNLKLIRK